MAKKTEKTKAKKAEKTEAKTVEIDMEEAREMFVAMGTKTAKKWDAAKLLGKLKSLDADDDTVDAGDYQKLYKKVVKANKAGNELAFPEDEEEEEEEEEVEDEAEEDEDEDGDEDDGDDEEEEEEEKPKSKKSKKGAKASAKEDKKAKGSKKGGKSKKASGEKKPGVIAAIVTILKEASKAKPITKEGIVKKLVKMFPDRSAESMAGTVNVQVPFRIQKEKDIKVNKNDDGYWIK
jgi:hypothetical protein